jgi:hypothetical protein
MKTATREQLLAIHKNAKEMRAALAKKDRLILQLMAHEDTTQEQLWDVHKQYVASVKRDREMQASLDKLFHTGNWYHERLHIQLR